MWRARHARSRSPRSSPALARRWSCAPRCGSVATISSVPAILENLWRREAPQVLGALLRRYGDLGDCEDAVQDAAEAAAARWPADGVPDDPKAWLIRVASR